MTGQVMGVDGELGLLRIDMIALMIMGRGITQTGMMDRFSDTVIRLAGTSRGKKNKEKPCC